MAAGTRSALVALLAIATGFAAGRLTAPARDGDQAPRIPESPSGAPSNLDLASRPPEEAPCLAPAVPRLPIAPRTGTEEIAPFEEGTAVLRIGDGYVFGEDRVRTEFEEANVDVVCEDIRADLTLGCPHGALAADVPLAAVGLPDTSTGAAALVLDAPIALPERHATLILRPHDKASGIALVKSAAGKTFKVWLLEARRDTHALRRLVRIAYAEVPAVDGGGVMRVATTSPLGSAETPTVSELRRLMKVGASVPSGDANYFDRKWERFTPTDDESKIRNGVGVLLDAPLRKKVTIESNYGAAYASAGVDTGGVLENRTYAGFAVRGDMAGAVRFGSYGYLHISGDLIGEVDAGSYATIVIDGDILGTLKVRSYVILLLRGRLLGKIDVDGACWSTFYFQGFRSRAELEAIPGNKRQITLHVESSDAPAGKIEGSIGTWRDVIVGDPAWKKIER
jgi:hypothetical protein